MSYFLFNKASDFNRGIFYKTLYESGALKAEKLSGEDAGIFISRLLDSREQQTVWHRLALSCDIPDNTALETRLYCLEEKQKEHVKNLLDSEEYTAAKKLRLLEPFLKLQTRNKDEILLNQIEGRYLFIVFLFWGNEGFSPKVSKIQLFFPWSSFVSWLPEIYEEKGGFLERYLAIFKTLYDEADQKIRDFPALLDIEAAEDELLVTLAGWLNMDNVFSWKPERLKKYLADGAAVYGRRGTKMGIRHIVHLYTGFSPYLIETDKRPGEFMLLIPEEAVPTYPQYKAFLKVINEIKPAHTEVQVICLKPFVMLGGGTYLGVNSVINGHSQSVLGEMARIGYSILGDRT